MNLTIAFVILGWRTFHRKFEFGNKCKVRQVWKVGLLTLNLGNAIDILLHEIFIAVNYSAMSGIGQADAKKMPLVAIE